MGPDREQAGVTRLGFAVMLRLYETEGRFPAYRWLCAQSVVPDTSTCQSSRSRSVCSSRIPPSLVRNPASTSSSSSV